MRADGECVEERDFVRAVGLKGIKRAARVAYRDVRLLLDPAAPAFDLAFAIAHAATAFGRFDYQQAGIVAGEALGRFEVFRMRGVFDVLHAFSIAQGERLESNCDVCESKVD